MHKKIRVGVVFGGRSAEHEVSLLSAKNIVAALDKKKYEPVLIAITKEGEWHLCDAKKYLLHAHDPKRVRIQKAQNNVALVAKEMKQELVSLTKKEKHAPIDVIFPVLHGTYGEDGAIQGLLKMAGVPFVGASVLGSAVGMDKDVMKRLLREANIPIARFITLDAKAAKMKSFSEVVKELGLPFFVKPANLGSSVGVSKVKNKQDYAKAINLAFQYDRKILIEEFIDGREIECSVLGNENPIASLPCEVIAKDEFYSYDAKYMDDSGTVMHIPAKVDKKTMQRVQAISIQAYKTLYCEGTARVDLFLKKDGTVYVNEINTIPGFTSTSAYPKLWAASGVSMTEIVDKLIQFAIERFEIEKSLKTTFV